MAYRVCGERIAVKPDETPRQIGSIVVAESVSLVPTTGTVLQSGPLASEYTAGQRIAFPERAGTLARIDDEIVRILTPDEVLAILPEEAVVNS